MALKIGSPQAGRDPKAVSARERASERTKRAIAKESDGVPASCVVVIVRVRYLGRIQLVPLFLLLFLVPPSSFPFLLSRSRHATAIVPPPRKGPMYFHSQAEMLRECITHTKCNTFVCESYFYVRVMKTTLILSRWILILTR